MQAFVIVATASSTLRGHSSPWRLAVGGRGWGKKEQLIYDLREALGYMTDRLRHSPIAYYAHEQGHVGRLLSRSK
jgi:hypothetical protein